MTRFVRSVWLAAVFAAALAVAGQGQAQSNATDGSDIRGASNDSRLDKDVSLSVSQDAIGRKVDNFRFLDSSGKRISIADLAGTPLVVSMVYTACDYTCPVITQTLAESIDVAREAVGKEGFTVLTVGFDTRNDTPDRMRVFARQQGVGDDNWLLLSADKKTIEAFARNLGFLFVKTPYGFDHLAQTTVIDGSGTVVAQVYGQDFAPPQLVEPLKNAVFGVDIDTLSVTGVINRVKLFCTIYDPYSERYQFDYSLFIGMVIGFVSVLAIGFVVVRAMWRMRAAA